MITRELVEKICRLANLHVEEREVSELSTNLSAIFDYMKVLERADVSTVQPMSHVLPQTNVTRPDEPQEPLALEEMLQNAPDASGRFIRVPIVIEPGTEH